MNENLCQLKLNRTLIKFVQAILKASAGCRYGVFELRRCRRNYLICGQQQPIRYLFSLYVFRCRTSYQQVSKICTHAARRCG